MNEKFNLPVSVRVNHHSGETVTLTFDLLACQADEFVKPRSVFNALLVALCKPLYDEFDVLARGEFFSARVKFEHFNLSFEFFTRGCGVQFTVNDCVVSERAYKGMLDVLLAPLNTDVDAVAKTIEKKLKTFGV